MPGSLWLRHGAVARVADRDAYLKSSRHVGFDVNHGCLEKYPLKREDFPRGYPSTTQQPWASSSINLRAIGTLHAVLFLKLIYPKVLWRPCFCLKYMQKLSLYETFN